MTEWKKEICGSEKPKELFLVSSDTYIERRNIVLVETESNTEDESVAGIGNHYECEYRFIAKNEYEMLKSIESIESSKAIDQYTMQLIESGVI